VKTDVQIVQAALKAATRSGAGLGEAERKRAEALVRLLATTEGNADRLPISAEFRTEGNLVLLTR